VELRRCKQRWISWVAVIAVLMSSLAPSISHAFAAQASLQWLSICSAAGTADQASGAPQDSKSGNKGMLLSMEHCPYCSLHAPQLALPPAPVTLSPQAHTADAVPLAFLAAPRTLHAWVSAQPRAPPVLL
jgi:hypothetical protein